MSLYDGDVKVDMATGEGEIVFAAGQPVMDAGLETAVSISLWTERGWWGSAKGDDIGSDVLAACRGALTPATRQAAEEATRKALAWLVADGVAASVEVSAIILATSALALDVSIYEPGATTPVARRYLINWQGQRARLEA